MARFSETEAMPSAESTTVAHWTYNVATPFRSPREISELAGGSASAYEALAAELVDPSTEFESPFRDLLELEELEYEALEDEAIDEGEEGEEEYLAGADLLEETPATDHPLAAVFSLPRLAFDAMAKGGWATAIAVAIGAGLRDVNKLANMIFWFRHPAQIGQKIRPDQPDLAREWLDIRDQIVKPALAGGTTSGPGAGSGPPTPIPATQPGATSSPTGAQSPIPSDRLKWQNASDEQIRFMRAVYDAHVAWAQRKGRRFVPDLPDEVLGWVDDGKRHRMRKDAAVAARSMLDAATAQLKREGRTGQTRIGIRSAYRTAKEQFWIWQGFGTGGGFPAYYEQTSKTRPKGDPHGPAAVKVLMKHMRGQVAAPGFSNHQHGTAVDLSTREGPGRLYKVYYGSWFHNWLKKNAEQFHFHPLDTEAWHWYYIPPKRSATGELSEAESWTDPLSEAFALGEVTPTSIRAGRANVAKVPVLASHRGRGPDMVLRWNDMPAVPTEVDVVVHLHGYSRANLTLPRDIEVWSGLDLAPVDGATGTGRTRPTLTVLPRGHFTGIPARNIYRYTFPALTTRDGLTALVQAALNEFSNRVGGQPPKAGRLILTAHSGGGAPLLRILRRHNPHEVHVFDGLYQDATALAEWAARRIQADRAAVAAGGSPGGAMRVFFRPGTRAYSRRVAAALAPALAGAPQAIVDRYRVEASTLGHWQIPRQYGWRILADPAADVPDASRAGPQGTAVKPRYEFDEAESAFKPESLEEDEEGESPFLPESLDGALDEDEGEDEFEFEDEDEVEEAGGAVNGLGDLGGFEDVGELDLFEDEAEDEAEELAYEQDERPDLVAPSAAGHLGEFLVEAAPADREATGEGEALEEQEDLEDLEYDEDEGEVAFEEFIGSEHKALGDTGTRSAPTALTYDRASSTTLTFGDIVALAGDMYGSYFDIAERSRTAEGRAELAWARWYALNLPDPNEPYLERKVQEQVENRYYTLAADNISHFSGGGGTGTQHYTKWHADAMTDAFAAGQLGDERQWRIAVGKEAFGCHFLTDIFSAGHVRTPRADIKEWYRQQGIGSSDAFVRYMAGFMHRQLQSRNVGLQLPIVSGLALLVVQKKVRALGGEALQSFSLGDIVSLALHNHDSVKGLAVVSKVDATGRKVAGGRSWTAYGDGHMLGPKGQDKATQQMATAAVAASFRELQLVREAGRKVGNRTMSAPAKKDLIQKALKGQWFRALDYVPKEVAGKNVSLTSTSGLAWRWGQLGKVAVDEVDLAVKGEIAKELEKKAKAVQDPAIGPGGVKIHGTRPALDAFVAHLRSDGIQALEKAVGKRAN